MLPLVDYSTRKKRTNSFKKQQLISLKKMNQCVPSCELDENSKLNFRSQSNSLSLSTPDVPTLDYEVAELTWENGQISMHGLGPPRVPTKTPLTSSQSKYTWDKPRAGGTLESIVDQATFFPHYKFTVDDGGGGGLITNTNELVPWLISNHNQSIAAPTSATATASATVVMDAMVPCDRKEGSSTRVLDSAGVVGTHLESCSGATLPFENERVARAGTAHERSSCRDQSVTAGSATFCRDSRQVTLDTCEREFGVGGFTSISLGSPENTSSGNRCTGDDHDSVCHSRPQKQTGHEEAKKKTNGKSSGSTKRSRAAAVHNQSERKRRDKINQRMKTLQKLVPNSSKTDKASMLDEVIEYLKQLQVQVNMMSRMNMSPMMLPLAVQQQLQMSMMAPMMGMGMGMGSMGMGMGHHVMDMSAAMAGRPNLTGMSPVLHPSAFIPPLTPWEGAGDQRLHTPASVMHDPMSTFLSACQSQPMTMDAYSRMMAMYQQLQQNSAHGAKN